MHTPSSLRSIFRRGMAAAALLALSGLFAGTAAPSAHAEELTAAAKAARPVVEDSKLLGQTIASLPLRTTEGEEKDICKEAGWKVVYFWSPYCPCVRNCQKLSLIPLAREYQAKGVAFYAVASNADNVRITRNAEGKERALLVLPGGAGQWPPYSVMIDVRHRAADLLQAKHTPQTFLLDPQNRVVFVGNPDDSEEILEKTGKSGEKTKDYLGDALKSALAGQPIALPIAPVRGCDILRVIPGAFAPAEAAAPADTKKAP